MLMSLFHTFTVLALVTTASAASPKSFNSTTVSSNSTGASNFSTIFWDGRIPAGSSSALFDTPKSPFGTSSVFGQNLTFSKLIKITNKTSSLFDTQTNTVPFEVTLSDSSIFVPGGSTPQFGFRRAELNPNLSSTIGSPAVSGVKTLHFSLQLDTARPFNYSHEYQLVFLETADFSNTQFTLKTGTILGGNSNGTDAKMLRLSGVGGKKELFATEFVEGWHNFGLVLDFNKNTTQVLYSNGTNPLSIATPTVSNNMAGGGLYHFGILKKPTGNVTDITHEGYQESGINEGLVYGGVWMEDSAGSVISVA